MGCTEASGIKYEIGNVLIETDLWGLAFKKLDGIPIPSNPPDDNGNDIGNNNKKESKKDGLVHKKDSSCTKYCLNKMEKIATS